MTHVVHIGRDRPRVRGSTFMHWARPRLVSVAATAWVIAAAFAYLAPALVHGTELGSQDILGFFGLGGIPGIHAHSPGAGDQIQEFIPWSALSWEQVHHGHLPLWNPYAGFGLPLLLNLSSAALSLPMLIAYLAPLHDVYTIQVIAKLVIGGTGVLWLSRRLGLSYLPSVLAATAFELSGAFTAWLGWPMSGTYAWLGWVVGAALMTIRGDHRVRSAAGLAIALAFAVYAGHPETLVVLVLCTGVVAASALVGLWVGTRSVSSLIRPVVGLLCGGLAALMLSAPLLLPGLQIISRGVRTSVLGFPLPAKAIVNVLFASYNGLPVAGSTYFGPVDYYEVAAYVGAVVVVLAGLAILTRWRDSTVIGLAVVVLMCVAVTYFASVSHVLDTVPILKNVQWTRSLGVLDFALAMLGGIGLQALLDQRGLRRMKWSFGALVIVVAAITGTLWIRDLRSGMPEPAASIQAHSFVWPAIQVLVLVIVAVVIWLPSRVPRHFSWGAQMPRRQAVVGWALFGIEVAFLLTATPSIWASTNNFFPATPAEVTLERDVGQARVGVAQCPSVLNWPDLGILAEANSAYGVREAIAYDGILPRSYFTSYFDEIGKPVPADTGFGQFCPSMTSAVVARHFGVGYVLGYAGSPTPPGMVLVGTIASERLYRVPGGSVVTVEPAGVRQDSAHATEVPVRGSDPSSMRLVVSEKGPSVMYVHVTNFPGWHATIDGNPLVLRSWGGTMLAASIPAGRHVVVMNYMPSAFKVGLLLAVLTALALIVIVAWSLWWPRHRAHRPPPFG